jgi:hypothetical protein
MKIKIFKTILNKENKLLNMSEQALKETIKILQNSQSEIQKSIHNVNTKNPAESAWLNQHNRTTWHARFPKKIDGDGSDTTVRYKLDNGKFDLLDSTILSQKWPAIAVRPQYEGKIEICWPHNLGTNVLESAVIKYGDDELPHIDAKYCDVYFQKFLDPAERSHHNWGIGNKPSLENWSTFLCEDETTIKLPWFFSRDSSVALPLYYCSNLSATMTVNYKRDILNLLRMRRINDDGTYEIIPADKQYLFLSKDNSTALPKPEITGLYIKLETDEVEAYKCWTREGKYGDFYFEDVVSLHSANPQKFDSNIKVELECDADVNAIFWFAENVTSTALGNLSNYTTNADNLYEGFNPIEHSTLTAGGNPIFKELNTNVLAQSLIDVFPGRPTDQGILGWSFTQKPRSLDAMIGVNMKDVKYQISSKIKDRDPYLQFFDPRTGKLQTKVSDGKDNDFILHVYLLVTRKVTFSSASDKEDSWKIEFNNPQYRELDLEA